MGNACFVAVLASWTCPKYHEVVKWILSLTCQLLADIPEEAVAELVGVGLALVDVLREDSASPPSVWSAALAVGRGAS